MPELLARLQALLADKAYDAQERGLDLRKNAGVQAVILPRTHRKDSREDDEARDKARHRMENVFATLKQFRGMATRYDQRAKTFLSAVYMAAALIWLN